MLIDANAFLDSVDRYGETALMSACRRGHEACARLLIDAKARTDLKHNELWEDGTRLCKIGGPHGDHRAARAVIVIRLSS